MAQQQTTSGSATTLAVTLGPLADAAASVVVGGVALGTNEAVTAGAGFAQIDLQPFLQGTTRGTLQTEDRTGGGSTVDWSWPTAANAGAIALEVKAASPIVPSNPPSDAETLARQFEPVLFFSANELFFPGTPSAMSSNARCGAPRRRRLFWAKLIAGNGLLGPLGAVAGIAWGIVEYAEANHGLNIVGTGPTADNPAPDVAGSPGTGKTVQPAGVTVPDAGGDVQDWTSAQGLTIDVRRYDFIVDRSTQPWWPGDFNQGGYLGRWGPRVETDPFGRRAGMRFPAFWRLFFLAFANGKASGAL